MTYLTYRTYLGIFTGMSNTLTEADKAQVRHAANEAVDEARRIHIRWHLDTKQTACPWGCGDGSGIVGR